ncbi:uncharacterized protein Dwil_GK27762 [Drosophila willistoni]|uniref:Peptidase M48 domain-containing protein n=1 Tax=Drosophila willistoni TaxID=7260 RepID=A0A0Q9X6Y7_DROWI|nr:uncharacterized protein Dwil_GK27762 [Drosophila willistoni]
MIVILVCDNIWFIYINYRQTFYDEILDLTEFVEFPISSIYIMNTDDPYSCANAYFFGMACCKRIVLSDTLFLNKSNVKQKKSYPTGRGLPRKQVAAVVAHELGHWSRCHFFITLILSQVHLFLSVFFIGLLYENKYIYESVGFAPGDTSNNATKN